MKRARIRRRTLIERDSVGLKAVPAGALYGIFTERAPETFSLSRFRAHPAFIRSLGLIKQAAAESNRRLGLLGGSDSCAPGAWRGSGWTVRGSGGSSRAA